MGHTMVTVIDEPIQVFAHFRARTFSPTRFVWRGRNYEVKRVNARWIVRDGANRRYHFAVQTDGAGDLHELYLKSESMQWYLGRIDTDG